MQYYVRPAGVEPATFSSGGFRTVTGFTSLRLILCAHIRYQICRDGFKLKNCSRSQISLQSVSERRAFILRILFYTRRYFMIRFSKILHEALKAVYSHRDLRSLMPLNIWAEKSS